jgi:hypothetical protein
VGPFKGYSTYPKWQQQQQQKSSNGQIFSDDALYEIFMV